MGPMGRFLEVAARRLAAPNSGLSIVVAWDGNGFNRDLGMVYSVRPEKRTLGGARPILFGCPRAQGRPPIQG